MKPRKTLPKLLPLVLHNDQPFAATRLRLFFEPTRAVLVDAYVGRGPPKGQSLVKPVKLAFELPLDPAGVKSGSALEVGVRYLRFAPQLAAAIWVPAPVKASVGSAPPTPTTAAQPLDKLPYTRSAVELATLRRDHIKRCEGLEQTRKQFFFQMDIDTDPGLASLNKGKSKAQLARLHAAAQEVQPVLKERVQNRGRFGKLTAELPDPLLKPSFKASLAVLTKYLAELIADHELDTPQDPPGLDATFEAFARGDLRVTTTIAAADGTAVPYCLNGEPDSANYFFLAELAILACRTEPASPLWPRLLRVFVRTQEIYCRAYSPQGAALQTWPDFTHKTWRGTGVPSDGVIENLRMKYATMGVEALDLQTTINAQNGFCW
jgi:hypothetical protein